MAPEFFSCLSVTKGPDGGLERHLSTVRLPTVKEIPDPTVTGSKHGLNSTVLASAVPTARVSIMADVLRSFLVELRRQPFWPDDNEKSSCSARIALMETGNSFDSEDDSDGDDDEIFDATKVQQETPVSARFEPFEPLINTRSNSEDFPRRLNLG